MQLRAVKHDKMAASSHSSSPVLVVVLLYFNYHYGLASFSTQPECEMEYGVQYDNGQLVITLQLKLLGSCRQNEASVRSRCNNIDCT